MSDEDWAYFLSRWDDYKLSTSLKGGEIVLQLMECCCEQLRRDHHRTYPKTGVGTVTEETRLSELKQLAVRQKNRMVNRVKLGTLKQDKGEPVRKFYGRVHSLASVSEYTVSCAKCQVPVPSPGLPILLRSKALWLRSKKSRKLSRVSVQLGTILMATGLAG